MRSIIERAARSARPLEYCAALLGSGDPIRGQAVVDGLVRLHNCDTRAGHFSVADADLRHAAAVARERGKAIIALLHSHPMMAAAASEQDMSSLRHSPHPWVIVSVCEAEGVAFAAYEAGSGRPIPI